MGASYWGRTRRAHAALCSLALLTTANGAEADTVTLTPQKAVYAYDGGPSGPDGQFQSVFTGQNVYVVRQILDGTSYEYRTGFDFQLPPTLLQPGVTISSAVLHVEASTETLPSADTLTVDGIPGSALPFVPDDFEIANPVASVALPPGTLWNPTHDFEVASRIQSLTGSGNDHASFAFRTANWGTFLVWKTNATLTISYSVSIGNAPALDLLAPATGLTVLQGDPVSFEANAYDVEDGELSASIQWTSSRNGSIGSGALLTTSSLFAGTHVITATVVDADGNAVSKTLSLNVQPNGDTPPTIALLAPAEGLIVTQGAVINFQAVASDAQDGDRTANLQWTSSINGSIGSGGSISVSTLSVGAHQIVATVDDTAGNSANAVVNIVVQPPANTAPTVTVTSPANGAALTAGQSFALSGTASDAEQGNLSSSLQWILDGTTTIATGANANAVISTAGAHTITARVTDSGGLTGERIVNVSVASAPPPPANYCTLRGNNSSLEWIAGVRSGPQSNVSGNNGGYRDYTSVQLSMTAGSANPITLTPGFRSSSYTERWAVWIDLNRDKVFSASELLYAGASSAAISTTLSFPQTTTGGTTRMRVAMAYGSTPPACGTFSYGEVEDYTVNILGGSPSGDPTYCASSGAVNSYEFIQSIILNGTTRDTGFNQGYGNFTATSPIPLLRGNNGLTVAPGFNGSTSYAEQWRIWIDFNKDGVFGGLELVFAGAGSSSMTGSVNVPVSATSGLTRMRVQMKFDTAPSPCEYYTSGEVEDYTVQIP
jgi:hypothetical protein